MLIFCWEFFNSYYLSLYNSEVWRLLNKGRFWWGKTFTCKWKNHRMCCDTGMGSLVAQSLVAVGFFTSGHWGVQNQWLWGCDEHHRESTMAISIVGIPWLGNTDHSRQFWWPVPVLSIYIQLQGSDQLLRCSSGRSQLQNSTLRLLILTMDT